jgi:hypothetical protein
MDPAGIVLVSVIGLIVLVGLILGPKDDWD